MPNVLVLSGPALPLLKMAEEMKPEGYELNVCTNETESDEVERLSNEADFVLAFGHGVSEGDPARREETQAGATLLRRLRRSQSADSR